MVHWCNLASMVEAVPDTFVDTRTMAAGPDVFDPTAAAVVDVVVVVQVQEGLGHSLRVGDGVVEL